MNGGRKRERKEEKSWGLATLVITVPSLTELMDPNDHSHNSFKKCSLLPIVAEYRGNTIEQWKLARDIESHPQTI